MANCGVLISSVNLSGLTTDVTFFPQTGGTVDLGSQVFPFSYVADYYYGTYDCYVPTYAYTYSIAVLAPTPTPTSTVTLTPTQTATVTSTPTPTPNNTSTQTQTPTKTPTQTQTQTNTSTQTQTPTKTPTQTQTQTPTQTETSTPTPTETSTQTPTPTNTQTPTPTPTETSTQTPTPTNTQTPTPTQLRIGFFVATGITSYDACNSSPLTTIYGDKPLFDNNLIFYSSDFGPNTINVAGFYNYSGQLVELDSNGNEIGGYTLCSILPTQTATPTYTPSPTPTIGYYAYSLGTGVTANDACVDFGSAPNTIYGTVIGGIGPNIGEYLYVNTSLTIPVTNGYYSNGIAWYQVTGGNGEITSSNPNGCP